MYQRHLQAYLTEHFANHLIEPSEEIHCLLQYQTKEYRELLLKQLGTTLSVDTDVELAHKKNKL